MLSRTTASLISVLWVISATSAEGSKLVSPRMPFVFVENRGQVDNRVRYIGGGGDFKAWFEDRRVVLQQGQNVVAIDFGGGGRPVITPERPMDARANYLHGNDSRHWQRDLPLFEAIRYSGLWPGVELTYTSEQNGFKAEYLVSPGADPDAIRLKFDGEARIQSDGTLRVSGVSGEFTEEKPVLYQLIAGKRIQVTGGFEKLPGGSIGFRTGPYDRTQPLVVDPSILFSGYFGGSAEDTITAVAIDAMSNVVVAGWTESTDLPVSGGAQMKYGGGVDAFVASFLPNGGGLLYCTYLGGSGEDQALGIATDSARNVYVTGWTASTNFPVVGAFQSHLKGTRDAFVTKLAPSGNTLVYSTYLGGSGVDTGYAIAVDSSGDAAIVGDSTSTDLPATAGVYQPKLAGGQDVFLAKLSPLGNSLIFLTYFGGSGTDHASCLYMGSGGGYFFGGYTLSSNLPLVDPFQPKSGGGQDGYYAKLSPDASTLKFSSYLGGYGSDQVSAIYYDPSDYVVVAGTTSSPNFPTTPGAFQTTFGGETDGFITRFNPSRGLAESTFLGGSATDEITGMVEDFHGVPYVTGLTDSPDFPLQYPTQAANAGGMDAFVVKLNTALSAVTYGTYLGGSGSDGGNAIAVDFETSITVAGQTGSGNFPVAGNSQPYSSEMLSSFLTKFAPNFTIGVAYGSAGQLAFTTDPWHIANDVSTTSYGPATAIPIVGDWNGTGTKEIGIFNNGTWTLDTNGNGILDSGDKVVQFGQAGDLPVVGDWLGTGHIALGLYRQGTFILDQSGHLSGVPTGQSDATFPFGQAGDLPVAADWNGSGTTKVGVFYNGVWQVDYTGSRIFANAVSYTYGQAGDLPVVGDWDSSGRPSKIGIYRQGLWVLDYDGDNAWTIPYVNEMVLGFGTTGYTPLVF